MWILFSQGDPIAGGAGWVGAGLLGGVLSWLLFVHLPSKDKQLKEFMEAKDELARSLVQEHRLVLQSAQDHCQQEIILIRQNAEGQMNRVVEAFESHTAAIINKIASLPGKHE